MRFVFGIDELLNYVDIQMKRAFINALCYW